MSALDALTREHIQRMAARLVAISPPGEGLCLIGGFRYRLINASCRRSIDIDYHFRGDLSAKQQELVGLLQSKMLADVHARFNLEGSVQAAAGPDTDLPSLRTVDMAFYCRTPQPLRVEIPVEITTIPCTDPPVVRTVAGTVFLTVSDADMIEAKILALVNRIHLQERDLLDIFLFQDTLHPDWDRRVQAKLRQLRLPPRSLTRLVGALESSCAVHARGVESVLREQVDPPVAANIARAGGGEMVVNTVLHLLKGRPQPRR